MGAPNVYLILLSATTCVYCPFMKHIVSKVAEKLGLELKVIELDHDTSESAYMTKLMAEGKLNPVVPQLLLVKDGTAYVVAEGVVDEDTLEKMIKMTIESPSEG